MNRTKYLLKWNLFDKTQMLIEAMIVLTKYCICIHKMNCILLRKPFRSDLVRNDTVLLQFFEEHTKKTKSSCGVFNFAASRYFSGHMDSRLSSHLSS